MDPLRPIFVAHGWAFRESSDTKFALQREEEGFVSSCEVVRNKFNEGDFCTSVSVTLAINVETAASDETVGYRLGWLVDTAREQLERDPFIKQMNAVWLPETKLIQLALGSYWTGHGFMLVAPYELYVASVGLTCDAQKSFLHRVRSRLMTPLSKPDADDWANDRDTYKHVVAHPQVLLPANSNKPLK